MFSDTPSSSEGDGEDGWQDDDTSGWQDDDTSPTEPSPNDKSESTASQAKWQKKGVQDGRHQRFVNDFQTAWDEIIDLVANQDLDGAKAKYDKHVSAYNHGM